MKVEDVTEDWLRKQAFRIHGGNRPSLEGTAYRSLTVNLDGRGEVTELWSEPWLSDGFVRPAHVYQSATDHGVVKCWHLHETHTDQFVVTRGKLQLCLVDLRESSSTYLVANSIIVGELNPSLLMIPPGVLHGWKALSAPEVIVFNLQSHVYDAADEYKFSWDCVLEDIWEPRNG